MANELIPISKVVEDIIRIEAKICEDDGMKPGDLFKEIIKAWNAKFDDEQNE